MAILLNLVKILATILSIARPTSSSVGSRSVPWLGKCLSMNYQITVYCAALCQIVSLHYLYRASLQRLASLPCRLFLSSGLQVMTREVHRLSFRRSTPLNFSDIAGCVYMIFVLSLTKMLVLLSLMLSILPSVLICAAASFFRACLSVHVNRLWDMVSRCH